MYSYSLCPLILRPTRVTNKSETLIDNIFTNDFIDKTSGILISDTSDHFPNFTISRINIKGVLHPWALFLKTLCIFSKNKATSDKVSYRYGQKCSKELKNHSFTSVETIVVKLQ